MKYIFYPDVFWVSNFAMDMLVLLLVRSFRKSRSSVFRMILSAVFGATASVVFFMSLNQFEIYQLLIHFILNPVMILIAFPVKGIRCFCKDFLTTYAVMFLMGGILGWVMESYGQWKHFWLWAIGGFGICMLILHGLENRKQEQQSYEILLLTGSRTLSVRGFLDTGNLLTDPLVNQPVHIIRKDLLQEELSGERVAIRYIPFHSLGEEQGLLPVVTLKAMYVKATVEKEEIPPLYIEKPVFGLTEEKLFQRKDYQVILNAEGISV